MEKQKSQNHSDKQSVKKPVRGTKTSKKNQKRWIVFASSLLAVASLVLALFLWIDSFLEAKFGLINIQTDTNETYEAFATEPLTEIDMPETVLQDFHGTLNEQSLPLICDTKDVQNILLLATDSRYNDEAGLTDSMMLLSINKKTDQIVLCSFLRDLFVKIPEDADTKFAGKFDKLTHVHAYGGPQLTMATLKENFNVDVQFYAKVNFNSFVKAVDALGGLDMELSKAEVWWINEFLAAEEIQEIFPSYSKKGLPYKDGVQHINGLQALGHARNRRVGSDWARTERQRNLISQMVTQAKGLSLPQINALLEELLPLVTTNMSTSMLKELAWNSLSYFNYDLVGTRVPLAGTYTEVNYNIIPDAEVNMNDLYEKIYGEKPPASTKKERNRKKNAFWGNPKRRFFYISCWELIKSRNVSPNFSAALRQRSIRSRKISKYSITELIFESTVRSRRTCFSF